GGHGQRQGVAGAPARPAPRLRLAAGAGAALSGPGGAARPRRLPAGLPGQPRAGAPLLGLRGAPRRPPALPVPPAPGPSAAQLSLFAPRLGLPLPGPGGSGVATLAAVQKKDAPALAQLDFGPDARYDVTAEQAAGAEVHLAPPLSALAPRMQYLQEQLAPA